jgi:cation/acetate symporter
VAPFAYGVQLARIEAMENRLLEDPAELEVRQTFADRARVYEARLEDVDRAMAELRYELEQRIRQLKAQGADFATVAQIRRELLAVPHDPVQARELWTRALRENQERAGPLGGMPRHAQAFRGDPAGDEASRQAFDNSRTNFMALVLCLMLGTVGLPHLLTRYYTLSSPAEARSSVAWSLFFIALLYIGTPALAALVKFEVLHNLVGSSFEDLPGWIAQWARLDPGLIDVTDVNGDRIVQLGEIRLGADLVMLATPELGGMPYVVSGLVAAGGLAAALSTADGLLLTISNALVHDIGSQQVHTPRAAERRVILSKFTLLAVAMLAAFVAALKPAEILALVSTSFSLAASAFFPAMACGLVSTRVDRRAAVLGMLVGPLVTIAYMVVNAPAFRHFWSLAPEAGLWWGVQPISAGVFGVPAGFAAIGLGMLWSVWRPVQSGSGSPQTQTLSGPGL